MGHMTSRQRRHNVIALMRCCLNTMCRLEYYEGLINKQTLVFRLIKYLVERIFPNLNIAARKLLCCSDIKNYLWDLNKDMLKANFKVCIFISHLLRECFDRWLL